MTRRTYWLAVLLSRLGESFNTLLAISFLHATNLSELTMENIVERYNEWLRSE